AELVGTDPGAIVAAAHRLLTRPGRSSSVVSSLYGDGRAGARSAEAIGWLLGLCRRPDPFAPAYLLPTPHAPRVAGRHA
ncbi:MAG: hypothetical protein LC708_03550, partial [Actinobacteria bacterium]|nr:hypothetical protein [Actinomycetota bacterium]